MNASLLKAAVFDLDGVVTLTAGLHAEAWARLFNDFLERRVKRPGEDLRPFEEADYLGLVDGKPRLDGIRAFLASRGIALPEGDPNDAPDAESIFGLGARKNQLFLELLDQHGVELDPGAVPFIRALRAASVRVGVATSSRNARVLLQRAGIESLFDACVDGVVRAELGLPGKPDPATFLECARRLGAETPARALVIEDAVAGVQAGRAGSFGLVIGVDRGGNRERLRQAGADMIVRELGELSLERVLGRFEARQDSLRRPARP